MNAKDPVVERIKSLILIDESNENRDLNLNQESKDKLMVAKISSTDYQTLESILAD